MQILETTDYKIFKRLNENREINFGRVKSLMDSFAIKNMLQYKPIEVNSKMQVIDGQHRLEAAKALGLPIYYVVIENIDLSDLSLQNMYQWRWSMKDFLHQYVEMGIESYIKINKLCEESGFSPSLLLHLFGDPNYHSGATIGTKNFKQGKFEVTDEEIDEARILIANINELKPFMYDSTEGQRDFVRALRILYTKVPHEELIKSLKTYSMKLEKRGSVRDFLRELEDIYNFRKSNRINLSDVHLYYSGNRGRKEDISGENYAQEAASLK